MKRIFQNKLEQLREMTLENVKKVLILSVFIGISVGLNASTIHWITFINTDDPNVGLAGKNSKSLIYERLIKTVDSELDIYGYNFKFYDYYSGNYSSHDCLSAISSLKCDTTDIIVFYYIGHGMRISKDKENVKYPITFIDNSLETGIPLSWIHQSLKDKKARFTLTIAVSSNTYIESNVKLSIDDVLLPSAQECKVLSTNNSQYKSSVSKAFLGFKGDIIVCSASPYQESWVSQTPYGNMDVFTYVLVSSFESKKFEKDFSWQNFLKDVSECTKEATKDMPLHGAQVPIYDYNLIQE